MLVLALPVSRDSDRRPPDRRPPDRRPPDRRSPDRRSPDRCSTGRTAHTAVVLVGLLLLAVGLAAAGPVGALPSAHAGVIRTIGPGSDVEAAMSRLRPGDVLRLNPGTYEIGQARPRLAAGTATSRIRVTATDPSRPPLLRGELDLFYANYWIVEHVRVQATLPGRTALYTIGGKGWIVRKSEFFGALQTNAYANVAIDGSGPSAPQGFLFEGNCVHDAAQSTRENTDHNIYVNFRGRAGSGGRIQRNIIWGHTNGIGIKLGNGGLPDALGPWHVQVLYNTIAEGGRQVLLHGDVRYNLVAGNLMFIATEPFTASPETTSVYIHDVTGSTNTFEHNYAYASDRFTFDPEGKVNYRTDNALRPNPEVANRACDGFLVGYDKAKAYGRYGSGRWPVW